MALALVVPLGVAVAQTNESNTTNTTNGTNETNDTFTNESTNDTFENETFPEDTNDTNETNATNETNDTNETNETENETEEQVTLCHRPPGNPENAQTITVGESAKDAHLAHGDTEGPCESETTTTGEDGSAEVEDFTLTGDGCTQIASQSSNQTIDQNGSADANQSASQDSTQIINQTCIIEGNQVHIEVDVEQNIVQNVTLVEGDLVLFKSVKLGESELDELEIVTSGSLIHLKVRQTEFRLMDAQSGVGLCTATQDTPITIEFDQKVDLEPVDDAEAPSIVSANLADGRTLFVKGDLILDEAGKTLTIHSACSFQVVGTKHLGADDYEPIERIIARDADAHVIFDEESDRQQRTVSTSFSGVVIRDVVFTRQTEGVVASCEVVCDCDDARLIVLTVDREDLALDGQVLDLEQLSAMLRVEVDGRSLVQAQNTEELQGTVDGDGKFLALADDKTVRVLLKAGELRDGKKVELFTTQSSAEQNVEDLEETADGSPQGPADDSESPNAEAPLGPVPALLAIALAGLVLAVRRRRG